ncbi:hypothetical protein P9112_003485 [Eukaryota sp. TZLM1-RC]
MYQPDARLTRCRSERVISEGCPTLKNSRSLSSFKDTYPYPISVFQHSLNEMWGYFRSSPDPRLDKIAGLASRVYKWRHYSLDMFEECVDYVRSCSVGIKSKKAAMNVILYVWTGEHHM